jgi:hypothetical protein
MLALGYSHGGVPARSISQDGLEFIGPPLRQHPLRGPIAIDGYPAAGGRPSSSLSPWLVPVVFLGGSGSALAQAAMIRAIDSTE